MLSRLVSEAVFIGISSHPKLTEHGFTNKIVYLYVSIVLKPNTKEGEEKKGPEMGLTSALLTNEY